VARLEEIAYRRGLIDRKTFIKLIELTPASAHRAYLQRVADDPRIEAG
jgi:hypothetical protein